MQSHKELFVIDANGFLHRNYHALPKLSTSKGEEVGAIYGFVNWLIRFIKEKNWRVLVVDLKCDIDKIIERLLARKRPDDNLNIVYKRHVDHMNLHPSVMEEIKTRHDLFDIITLNGNLQADIVFSNFLLDVMRLVDMIYFYDMTDVESVFHVKDDETTINPAICRWICSTLKSIQEKLR